MNRTMPLLAVAMIGMGKNATTQIWKHGGKQLAGGAAERLNEVVVSQQIRDRAIKEGQITLTGTDLQKHKATNVLIKPVQGWHQFKGTSAELSMQNYHARERERLEKQYGKNAEGVDSAMQTINLDHLTTPQKTAFMEYGVEHKGSKFLGTLQNKGKLEDFAQTSLNFKPGLAPKTLAYAPDLRESAPELTAKSSNRSLGGMPAQRKSTACGKCTVWICLKTK